VIDFNILEQDAGEKLLLTFSSRSDPAPRKFKQEAAQRAPHSGGIGSSIRTWSISIFTTASGAIPAVPDSIAAATTAAASVRAGRRRRSGRCGRAGEG